MPTHNDGPVVIAGRSGFLGRGLAAHLAAQGRACTLLSRHAPTGDGASRHVTWDARTLGPWVTELDGASAVVNLAGRTVDCVKTPDHCDEILRSRVEATRVLGLATRELAAPPPVWVQMSTAHRYGDPPEVRCDEDAAFGYGLAPTVGAAWEEAFEAALRPPMRGVVLRTSFVLGRAGGAMTRLAMLARWGLGGRVGHGRQGMSWIHERDMNRLFERAIDDETMVGAYLATAPNPVSNATFMRALRRAIGMPLGLPSPAPLVRLGAALVLRTDPELALYGRYCVSRRLREAGFAFDFPDLDGALADLYGR
ncbi:MAG: DUF1731 domain-containing protein [Phycisphaerales bacterium]|nr:DUF1731 domain-containing protein [Phycisphaerales bacterium]